MYTQIQNRKMSTCVKVEQKSLKLIVYVYIKKITNPFFTLQTFTQEGTRSQHDRSSTMR